MTIAHVLTLPDFDFTFKVESDASSTKIGVVLGQAGKPIAYYNKALAPRHQILPINEK